jgi:cobalt-zinc-cadmium efflux system outer membrane protein
MKLLSKSLILSFMLLIPHGNISYCQKEISHTDYPVTLTNFLSSVIQDNLGLVAEQFNVSIAEAEFQASKAIPDPEISIIYSNNEDRTLRMGQSVEGGISYPINLGNKRRAGINLARSQYELSRLMLGVYFQNLRAEASITYFAALKSQRIYLLQREIQEQLSQLARADSLRYNNGEATGLDALQSSLEARSQQTEVDQSLADMQNALLQMMFFRGNILNDRLENPSDSFPVQGHHFELNSLINNAIEQRSEFLAAIKNKEVSEKYLKLIKADRAPELNLETGYSYNSIVRNDIAPAPDYNSLSAGVSIPLKFSGINKGSLNAAELAVKQRIKAREETELQIKTEVIQAYNNFIAQNRKIERYNMGLIRDAEEIMKGRIYSYQHGESGLVDVLNAQRTYSELQLNYINALFEYTASLIELERSAGIWDLTP